MLGAGLPGLWVSDGQVGGGGGSGSAPVPHALMRCTLNAPMAALPLPPGPTTPAPMLPRRGAACSIVIYTTSGLYCKAASSSGSPLLELLQQHPDLIPSELMGWTTLMASTLKPTCIQVPLRCPPAVRNFECSAHRNSVEACMRRAWQPHACMPCMHVQAGAC